MHAAPTTNGFRSGLEGTVVAETTLSDVDGERGELIIAGERVEALAGRVPFEELCARLWTLGDLRARTPEAVGSPLGQARVEAFARLPSLGGALALGDGMDALRAALAQLPGDATDERGLTAAAAVYAAAWARRQAGAPPVPPDPAASHAADYLRMSRGQPPHPAEAAALDAYLVTVSDHGMNASTFTARVVASTGSDAVSAVVAAVGALKGPLHGGAPGPVLDMLDAIGTEPAVAGWIGAELAGGRRIMGMGHRIYRVRDPRALVLERALAGLRDVPGRSSERLQLARAVEKEAEAQLAARHPDRPLRANVEFYTALLLEAVGLPRQQFSVTFAVGRVAGWLAHVFEQRRTGRLIRPASRYVGPLTSPR